MAAANLLQADDILSLADGSLSVSMSTGRGFNRNDLVEIQVGI